MNLNAIILSAGKGTRMKSSKPKVIQEVCGVPMINLVLNSLTDASIKNNYVVIGYKAEDVESIIEDRFNFEKVIQKEQLGTGHAVKSVSKFLESKEGVTVVTYGDTPLVRASTYKDIISHHIEEKNDITVLTAEIGNPTGYGRIIRDDDSNITSIVEHKDATKTQLKINEINTGIYCFDNKKLFDLIKFIDNNNVQEEYYLTDLVDIFKRNDFKVGGYVTKDVNEVYGVNDLVNLAKASEILKKRINSKHLINGVNILDPNNTYIGPYVKIGQGTVIEPNNFISGDVTIGETNHLKAGNYIVNSTIGSNNTIGPSSHLRDGAIIGDNLRIGNYVEIKNSTLGDNTKAAHLTYIGDSVIGKNVNFGCGCITANYDGKYKFKIEIEDNVFIGSNTNLVAPLKIAEGSFIAAGCTITDDIGTNKFVIGRSKVEIKERKDDREK